MYPDERYDYLDFAQSRLANRPLTSLSLAGRATLSSSLLIFIRYTKSLPSREPIWLSALSLRSHGWGFIKPPIKPSGPWLSPPPRNNQKMIRFCPQAKYRFRVLVLNERTHARRISHLKSPVLTQFIPILLIKFSFLQNCTQYGNRWLRCLLKVLLNAVFNIGTNLCRPTQPRRMLGPKTN